jgi:hypothetical protein
VTHVTVARLVLAFAGIGLFFWAKRVDQQSLRWVAIAVIAVALLLRFAEKRRRGTPDRQGPSM